jgi:molybdopterin molybdotransferase
LVIIGGELVLPGRDLLPGQIYESNGPMLVAAIEAAGAQAELLPFVTDDTGSSARCWMLGSRTPTS